MPKPSGLAAKLKAAGVKEMKKRKEPLWRGPEIDGITQSLLGRFLVCRERFRLLVVEGLKPNEGWNHRLGYGNLWHTCEEALAANEPWQEKLKEYARAEIKAHPMDQETIRKWYNVCLVQFPEYVKYWAKHPDVKDRTPVFQEKDFNVLLTLPSGRVVRLRGKWDAVDSIGKGKNAGLWLQENKSKGDINELQMQRQLTFDLQTMLYLVALYEHQAQLKQEAGAYAKVLGGGDRLGTPVPIKGVRYNVIRRPLSGGKGSIKQAEGKYRNAKNKAEKLQHGEKVFVPGETDAEYYERLRRDYLSAEPEYWFMRWTTEISPEDINKFKVEFLYPILEQLCLWWDWVSSNPEPFNTDYAQQSSGIHWRTPFGFYNVLAEGGSTDVDEFLLSGSEVGLTRTENLFPELT